MVYPDYEDYRYKYYIAQENYNQILEEKEELFLRTQPKSVEYDKERVSGGNPENSFDKYIIAKEKKNLDERLNEARTILEGRKILLNTKLDELSASNHIHDKVYYQRYIERKKIKHIARKIGYSEAQTYRILESIKKRLL
jgi:hypothetical protein